MVGLSGTWSSLTDLLDEIGHDESQHLEFKQSVPRSSALQEPMVAFGNAGGGRIVIGLTDRRPRELTGIGDGQETLERVEEAARAPHPPLTVHPCLVTIGRATVCVIDVPPVRRGFVQTSSGRVRSWCGPAPRTAHSSAKTPRPSS